MQNLILGLAFILILGMGWNLSAQDWDDFDPPPPGDYGDIPPPPPPPFNNIPYDDNPPPPRSNFPSRSFGEQVNPGSSISNLDFQGTARVKFKKTGKQKDLTKKNPRIEELLNAEKQL